MTDEPVDICIPFPLVTTAEELQMETTYVIGEDGLYPAEYFQQNFLKAYNSDVTLDSILAELEKYSPEYVASVWG